MCANCEFSGDAFKVKKLTHHHCEHERYNDSKISAWETLRVFSDICEHHKFKEGLK